MKRIFLFFLLMPAWVMAQDPPLPSVRLLPAPLIKFPEKTDSNSPAFWSQGGFYLFNSFGHPVVSVGSGLTGIVQSQPVIFNNEVPGRRWMEAVVLDDEGVLYGYYHMEPHQICPGILKTAPRIGSARSYDNGFHWEDLGHVLEARPESDQCVNENRYFVGGNGDFSVMLDPEKKYLYFFYSAFGGDVTEQGVAVARLEWKDRGAPAEKVWKYYKGWTERGLGGDQSFIYPASISWHISNASAFWGPSIHWNTYLQQYVMLLNRSKNGNFDNEGIYIAYSKNLSDPSRWSQPQKILNQGNWYPQVIGLESGVGTDKFAGRKARFFLGGESSYIIDFTSAAPQ